MKTTKNKIYSKDFKQEAIDRVLINNETIMSVAIDTGLPSDRLLKNWIKKYKERGYNIVVRKQGWSTMPKVVKKMKLKMKKQKD